MGFSFRQWVQRWLLGLILALILTSSLGMGHGPVWAVGSQGQVEWFVPESAAADFQKAMGPMPLSFPRDFGPHADYQTEWWYYTGNLETAAGRPFGYELTIFRRGLTPGLLPVTESESDWRSNQVYFAHFTLSDIQKQNFYPSERFSRGAAGLAGAQAEPYRIWLDDWAIAAQPSGQVQLQAQSQDISLDLSLTQTLPPILEGDRGYSQKGPEPGNASYYYSLVQQPTAGTVTVAGEVFPVSGTSWMDHEFSTSALSAGTEGWDWFSLELEDGSALMLYGLRRTDGTTAPESSGTYIAADGTPQHLNQDDFQMQILDHWTSPTSKARYPAQWAIAIPKLDIALEVTPLMPNQELNISTTYWEGAVGFTGVRSQQPIQGKGYAELTGYDRNLSF